MEFYVVEFIFSITVLKKRNFLKNLKLSQIVIMIISMDHHFNHC